MCGDKNFGEGMNKQCHATGAVWSLWLIRWTDCNFKNTDSNQHFAFLNREVCKLYSVISSRQEKRSWLIHFKVGFRPVHTCPYWQLWGALFGSLNAPLTAQCSSWGAKGSKLSLWVRSTDWLLTEGAKGAAAKIRGLLWITTTDLPNTSSVLTQR